MKEKKKSKQNKESKHENEFENNKKTYLRRNDLQT